MQQQLAQSLEAPRMHGYGLIDQLVAVYVIHASEQLLDSCLLISKAQFLILEHQLE
jgi:hypothetical protein